MTPEQAQELWTKPYERLVEWNGDTPPITFTHRLIKDFDTMQGWISAQEREIESLRTQLSDALKRADRLGRAHTGEIKLHMEWQQIALEMERERDQLRADLTRVAQERDDLGLQLATKTFEAQDAWDALARVTEENEALKNSDHYQLGYSRGHLDGVKAVPRVAQSRIQALEGMVGMLRDALTAASKILPVGSIYSGDNAGVQSTRNMVNKALSLTESQAAEVVRGMERVCEAVNKRYSAGALKVQWRDLHEAMAALEAVRNQQPGEPAEG